MIRSNCLKVADRLFFPTHISSCIFALMMLYADEISQKIFLKQRPATVRNILITAIYSSFAVMVGLCFARFILKRAETPIGSAKRPMTREDNEKSDLGVDYYKYHST